ncbi:MAG: tetratricopeptide repeat protein [Oligoflexia bacterium]|nr:tetratricopeptide repeat protein [Oligoflexia bacterium]
MSQEKLWLLKYKNGRIQGPLSTDEIIRLIQDKTVYGEETIAVYPGGRWKPISIEPQFYEPLLNILSKSDDLVEEHIPYTTSPSSSSSSKESYFSENQSMSSETVVADTSELKDLHKKRRKKKRKSSIRLEEKKKKPAEKTVVYYPSEEKSEYQKEEYLKTPLEEEEEKSSRKGKKKKAIFILFPILILCIFWFALEETDQEKKQEYIVLKMPRANQVASSVEQTELLIKKGLGYYLRSTVSSHVKAQALLVQAVEGDIKNTYAMAMLCLVYMELWPFTEQDSQAMRVLSHLVQKTSVFNKGGVRSGLCHSVNLLIKGKYEDAKTMVESSLDGLSKTTQDKESQRMIPFFYYLKGVVLYYLKDYTTMMSYIDTIQKMLPTWIAPYMLAADTLMKQNKVTEALSFYRKVIKLNPAHKSAKIKLHLIEYKHFNKMDTAAPALKMALAYPERVSNQTLSDAYFGLAEISVKKGDSMEALDYARQAYSYNPANKASRNLVVQLGGVKKLKQTRVRSSQLIYEGDQLMSNNKFQSAIGYYEEAFTVDDEKNSMAALKAAKAYWALSFSDQAIDWLKKAINANPQMMEAYVLMTEYYAELYDFYNAEKTLQIAFRKAPRSYELYRGRAYLSLKQQDYPKAIQYAKMALRIYEADMESYVILSEAYGKLGDNNESLASATRGLEVDPNAIKTQVAYAKALGRVYGSDTGVNYFKKLVGNYPLVMEFRMELVKYLFEDERYQTAKEELQRIIDIEPKYNEAYFYMGRILMFEENMQGAYEAFLQAAILNPSSPQPTFYIGQLRLKERKLPEAKQQFEKVLDLNPLYPEAHYYLGRVAFLKEDYEKAIEHARLESRSNKRLIRPYLLAGESYENLGQFLNCAVEYQKAVELDIENMSFYVKTARCYRKSGHLDLAIKILKKASGDSSSSGTLSGDPQLYKELGVIYEMRGAYPEAAGAYCNYLNLMPRAPDRRDIEKRMKRLSELTGKELKNCG